MKHPRLAIAVMAAVHLLLFILTLLLLTSLGAAWMLRGNRFLSWGEAATLLSCEAGVTAASLAVVRLAGYRLMWHWPFQPGSPISGNGNHDLI